MLEEKLGNPENTATKVEEVAQLCAVSQELVGRLFLKEKFEIKSNYPLLSNGSNERMKL